MNFYESHQSLDFAKLAQLALERLVGLYESSSVFEFAEFVVFVEADKFVENCEIVVGVEVVEMVEADQKMDKSAD